jgi:AcrR family transcriptional regulator
MDELNYNELAEALDRFMGETDLPEAKRRKRLRIVEAATELFIRNGYRKTSVEEVARRAGVAKGTVYLYFKTKAHLLVQAVCREKRDHLDQLRPILEGGQPLRERFRRWLQLVLATGADMPLLGRLISGDREILQVMDEITPQLWDQIQQARVDVARQMLDRVAWPHYWTPQELTDRAAVLVAVMHSSLLTDDRIRMGLSRARFGEILAELLVDGVCHNRAEPPDSGDSQGGERPGDATSDPADAVGGLWKGTGK